MSFQDAVFLISCAVVFIAMILGAKKGMPELDTLNLEPMVSNLSVEATLSSVLAYQYLE